MGYPHDELEIPIHGFSHQSFEGVAHIYASFNDTFVHVPGGDGFGPPNQSALGQKIPEDEGHVEECWFGDVDMGVFSFSKDYLARACNFWTGWCPPVVSCFTQEL